MENNTQQSARVISFSAKRAARASNVPRATDDNPRPITETDSSPRSWEKPEANMLHQPRPFPYIKISLAVAATSLFFIAACGTLGTVAALLVWTVATFVGTVAALGLKMRDRRRLFEQAALDEEKIWTEKPVTEKAGTPMYGLCWYLSLEDSKNAQETFALVAPLTCDSLSQVSKVVVKSDRVPAGIKYDVVKHAKNTGDNVSFILLQQEDKDRFGRAYHARLRNDLLSGDTEILDLEMEFKDGSVMPLAQIKRFMAKL